MTNLSPQTIGNTIQEKITVLFQSTGKFLPENSIQITRIYDELNKLGKVDAARRSLLLVLMYTLCGNREQADYFLRNSKKLHFDHVQVELAQLTMLLSLGYFSESIPVLRRLANPTTGSLVKFLADPPGGAFHILNSILDLAKTMNLANIPETSDLIPTIVRIMDQWGDTDDDYSNALDIAGTIMRERKLFFKDTLITIPVEAPLDGGFGYVKMSCHISVDIDTAIDMTCIYAERLASSHLKIPQSMVFEFEAAA